MREKQTDEGHEAPIRPQIALTTETKKPASFNVSAIGLQYVLVCSITIRISPPSFLSVDASFFKSLFVWWTSKGRSTISPPGLRTATVLLLLDTSIPTAVITAASIFLTSFNAGSAYAHYRFSLLCDTNAIKHIINKQCPPGDFPAGAAVFRGTLFFLPHFAASTSTPT